MFNIVLWIHDQKTDATFVEPHRCEHIAVSGDKVFLTTKDGVETFNRDIISMIDFNSRGVKHEDS